MILISACLAGINCKYSGGNNEVPRLKKMWEEGQAIAVCPERAGGLPVPRPPAEIVKDRVINTGGEDVTVNYKYGAMACLRICEKYGCTKAVLKAYSPSCGPNGVYDGTFTHTVIPGKKGIFAKMLSEAGVECIDETEYEERKDEFV